MVFCCRELLFSKLFYRHQQQQPPLLVLRAAAGNRSFFSRISDDTLGTFFVWFWTLLVLQSYDVLLPGAAFFEAVLPASAAAAAAIPVLRAAAGNRSFFSIGFQTTRYAVFSCGFRPCSSFRAMVFCCRELLFSKLFYRHQQRQPPLPVLRAAAGNRSFFSRISDDTLGTFFVWFWTLLVLQSHVVFCCRELLFSKRFYRHQQQQPPLPVHRQMFFF